MTDLRRLHGNSSPLMPGGGGRMPGGGIPIGAPRPGGIPIGGPIGGRMPGGGPIIPAGGQVTANQHKSQARTEMRGAEGVRNKLR